MTQVTKAHDAQVMHVCSGCVTGAMATDTGGWLSPRWVWRLAVNFWLSVDCSNAHIPSFSYHKERKEAGRKASGKREIGASDLLNSFLLSRDIVSFRV